MRIQSPCLNCSKRKVGCHSKCQEYKDFRSELDEYNAYRHRQQELDSEYYEVKNRKFK